MSEQLPSSELPELANDLRLACQRIARRVRFEGTAAVAPHQFSVLVRVRHEPRTPTELAELERVSTPSMTRTVSGLVDAGLVERQPHHEDRRQVLVGITEAGRAVVQQTFVERDSWMMRHLDGLDAEQLRILRQAADILLEVAAGE
ncbi:MarR family winged helix-turn-helix transcriptional regulator [Luteococcus sp. Sow4_B9]|uniref:MarR family winged helix-turn-helix transcriptional regulator n=1 Tax=Luteococcus sp. Sow4_B9 TaxID=3438792 RepID=UPI003F9D954A